MKKNINTPKICLVCSSGGHFLQLYSLRPFWERENHFWVSFAKEDTQSLLKDEKKYWAYQPTNRNIPNLIRNIRLAFQIIKKERPTLVISTGAGVAVPFICAAKFFGIKTIYVESLTRIRGLSLSGKMLYGIVDHLFVQWPEMALKYKKARYEGQVI